MRGAPWAAHPGDTGGFPGQLLTAQVEREAAAMGPLSIGTEVGADLQKKLTCHVFSSK